MIFVPFSVMYLSWFGFSPSFISYFIPLYAGLFGGSKWRRIGSGTSIKGKCSEARSIYFQLFNMRNHLEQGRGVTASPFCYCSEHTCIYISLHLQGIPYVIYWKDAISTYAACHFRHALLSVVQRYLSSILLVMCIAIPFLEIMV